MKNSIATRVIVLVTLCSALIIALATAVDYRLSRTEILERVTLEASDTINSVVTDLENALDGVEGSTRFLARVLEQREYSPEGLEQLLRDVVSNSEDIIGGTIALSSEYTPEGSSGFAPYYYRSDTQGLQRVDLNEGRSPYTDGDWYQAAVQAGRPVWVEPYFDASGAKLLMTTFSVPAYRVQDDGSRRLYAVVTADVSLAELQQYLGRLKLGEQGFGFLLSQGGHVLSGRSQDQLLKHHLDIVPDPSQRELWSQLFDRAILGETITQPIPCPQLAGQCLLRLSILKSTGWPVGVLRSEDELLAPLRSYQWKTVLIGLLTLLAMAGVLSLVTRRLTRPLTALTEITDEIARGRLDVPLPRISGTDEVSRLIAAFAEMKRNLKTYIADLEFATASRSRLEAELNAAHEIQMSMLPQGGLAAQHGDGFRLWARVRPARRVGGDLYHYCLRPDNTLFLAVGDVSDKGITAALFMAKAISHLQQCAGDGANPSQTLARLNNVLEQGNDNCMFVTLFCGVLDLPSGKLVFASAGHPPPSLLRGGFAHSLDQASGPVLGLVPDQNFPQNTLALYPDDRLAIYTDGIDEAFNEEAEMFGTNRLNGQLAAAAEQALADCGDTIFDAIDRFAGAQPQSDDIALMLLQLYPREDADAGTEFRLQLTRNDSLTRDLHQWLAELWQRWQAEPAQLMDLQVVAEEIITNIDRHAGLPSGSLIEVTAQRRNQALTLVFTDSGTAFNPLTESERTPLGAAIESAEVGGLGVHLVTALTDEQSYQRIDGRNVLTVKKTL